MQQSSCSSHSDKLDPSKSRIVDVQVDDGAASLHCHEVS